MDVYVFSAAATGGAEEINVDRFLIHTHSSRGNSVSTVSVQIIILARRDSQCVVALINTVARAYGRDYFMASHAIQPMGCSVCY